MPIGLIPCNFFVDYLLETFIVQVRNDNIRWLIPGVGKATLFFRGNYLISSCSKGAF